MLLLGFTSTVPLGSESRRAQDHILLSQFLRLPQPGRPGPVFFFRHLHENLSLYFSFKESSHRKKKNTINWITSGILNSCKRKRDLLWHVGIVLILILKITTKNIVKFYLLLSRKPKKLNYADKIDKSFNKNKAIWDIVKLETNKTGNMDKVKILNIEGILVNNHKDIAN
jgi:hypothetical protein